MTKADVKLKKLQELWRKKLAKSGFIDCETPDGKLKRYESYKLREMNANSTVMINRQRYYELAREFYHRHTFDTRLEKEMWGLHSEGVSSYEIPKLLKRSSQAGVDRVLQKLKKIMLSQRVGIRD